MLHLNQNIVLQWVTNHWISLSVFLISTWLGTGLLVSDEVTFRDDIPLPSVDILVPVKGGPEPFFSSVNVNFFTMNENRPVDDWYLQHLPIPLSSTEPPFSAHALSTALRDWQSLLTELSKECKLAATAFPEPRDVFEYTSATIKDPDTNHRFCALFNKYVPNAMQKSCPKQGERTPLHYWLVSCCYLSSY